MKIRGSNFNFPLETNLASPPNFFFRWKRCSVLSLLYKCLYMYVRLCMPITISVPKLSCPIFFSSVYFCICPPKHNLEKGICHSVAGTWMWYSYFSQILPDFQTRCAILIFHRYYLIFKQDRMFFCYKQ